MEDIAIQVHFFYEEIIFLVGWFSNLPKSKYLLWSYRNKENKQNTIGSN